MIPPNNNNNNNNFTIQTWLMRKPAQIETTCFQSR